MAKEFDEKLTTSENSGRRELPRKYSVFFLSPNFQPYPPHNLDNTLMFEMTTPGIEAISNSLQERLSQRGQEGKIVKNLNKVGNDVPIVVGEREKITSGLKAYLKSMVEDELEVGRTPIIGFSIWAGPQKNDVFELSKYVKKISPNVVTIFGGPGLHDRDPDFEEACFEEGRADILAPASGEEVIDFIANLQYSDSLSRDNEGILQISSPRFKDQFLTKDNHTSERLGLKSGIYTLPIYQPDIKTLVVYLPGSGCVHDCHFCAIGAHERKQILRPHIDQAAKDINDKMRDVYSSGDTPNTIHFANPNPLQDRKSFQEVISKIENPSDIETIGHFMDIYQMRNLKGLQAHIDYIDFVFDKFPNLKKLIIEAGRDSVQAKNDSDKIGKVIRNRPLTEEEHNSTHDNFFEFLRTLKAKGYDKKMAIRVGYIMHPWMDADLYLKRFDEIFDMDDIFGSSIEPTFGPLQPFGGTKINRDHKGLFVPDEQLAGMWEGGYERNVGFMSAWAQQYENSTMLDMFTTARAFEYILRDGHFGSDYLYGLYHTLSRGKVSSNAAEALKGYYADLLNQDPKTLFPHFLVQTSRLFISALEKHKNDNDVGFKAHKSYEMMSRVISFFPKRERYFADRLDWYDKERVNILEDVSGGLVQLFENK